MDSEVTSLSGIKTLVVPDSTTISAFGATLVDDASAAAAIATLGLDADIATLSLPASTTISAFGATLIDDASAADARTTLSVQPTAAPTFTGTFTIDDGNLNVGINAAASIGIELGDRSGTATTPFIDFHSSATDADYHARLIASGGTTIGTGTLTLTAATFDLGATNLTTSGTIDGRDVGTDGTKLDGIEALADVTDATNVDAAGAVMESDYINSAIRYKNSVGTMANVSFATNSVLVRQTGEIGNLPIGASELLGRASTGNVRNLTAAEVRTLINVEDGADVTDATNVNAAGAVMESDFVNTSLRIKNSAGVMANAQIVDARLVGRSGGEIQGLAKAAVLSIINVEDGADVTDTTNVTAAGALMDSEVDADIKTLVLPANTTISAFGATLIDDAAASNARTTLGLVIGTDVMPELAVASLAQAQDGTSTTEYSWTPQRVHQAAEATPHYIAAQVVANDTDVATGTDQALIHVPFARKLTAVHAEVATAGTTGVSTFDINRNGTSMLSTKLTIDSAETGSDTAATAAVIDAAQDDTSVNDVITIDVDGVSTTAPKGLVITMTFENS
jgi:hypothetical protein